MENEASGFILCAGKEGPRGAQTLKAYLRKPLLSLSIIVFRTAGPGLFELVNDCLGACAISTEQSRAKMRG